MNKPSYGFTLERTALRNDLFMKNRDQLIYFFVRKQVECGRRNEAGATGLIETCLSMWHAYEAAELCDALSDLGASGHWYRVLASDVAARCESARVWSAGLRAKDREYWEAETKRKNAATLAAIAKRKRSDEDDLNKPRR
jgi:hypothetical protein